MRISFEELKRSLKPERIGAGVVKSLVMSWCHDTLWPLLNSLTPKDLQYLVETDKPIFKYLPKEWVQALDNPELRNWSWAFDLLKPKDFIDLLPPWIGQFLCQNEQTYDWFLKHIHFLRWKFTGRGRDPWAQCAAAGAESVKKEIEPETKAKEG